MEARVHQYLSSFLAQHSLQDAVSNIDDIVLTYMLGILDLIGQGEVEDCFDLEDVMDMMNAYLPGFDQIDRSTVMDWMYNLAADLKKSESEGEDPGHDEETAQEEGKVADEKSNDENPAVKQSSFPQYDFNCSNEGKDSGNGEKRWNRKDEKKKDRVPDTKLKQEPLTSHCRTDKCPTDSPAILSLLPQSKEQDKEQKSSSCKRKKRYLSWSSQESQDESSKSQVEVEAEIDECIVRKLLDMFPATCSMEAKHCLHACNGDLNVAAQLIMDRQEIGQSITESQAVKNNRKPKKVSDYKLDDDGIKSCVIERYSFYDVAEDEKTHKPPPLKNEAKKLVRYRDGQIVSIKGERFSEIKKT